MPHNTSLIVAIAAGVGLAFVLGLVVSRLRFPPLLGYLLAGLAVGPFTPGLVADGDVTYQLSEIGVTLLMFGVGLHFSIKDLLAVRRVAIPGALVQITVATVLGIGAAHLWGMSLGAGIVIGLSLSVASTVVLLRALGDRSELDTATGRIAVGWLVVEDLVVIVALVLMPTLAVLLGGKPIVESDQTIGRVFFETLFKLLGFVGLMLILGKRLLPKLLGSVFRHGPRELFTTGIVAVALVIAFGASALFGVSPALGAFLAGVVIAESDLSHQAAAEIKPLETIFSVLFFVSIGMLFDPSVLVKYPVQVLTALLIVLIGKSIAAAAIMRLFKFPIGAALMISASLAQIGELSFILAGLGLKLELISQAGLSIVLAVGVLSIAVNPLVFSLMDRLARRLELGKTAARVLDPVESEFTDLEGHVVMVGYGRVGRIIGRALKEAKVPYIVVDFDHEVVASLQEGGSNALFGDATRPRVLEQARLERSKLLVVATPANSRTREIVESARIVRPELPICVRTHQPEDYQFLNEKVQRVVLGELETALQMVEFALERTLDDPESAERITNALRQHPLA